MTENLKELIDKIKVLQEKLRKLEEQEPEMLLMRQGKVDIVDYNHRTHYRIKYTDSFSGVYKWFVRKLGEIPFLEEIRDVNVYAPLEELYQKEVVKQKDDHPYKIADEHGETNPLNSVDDEKKMEELGFVKNSDGNWTAQPLGETEPEEVKKLQEKNWYVDAKTLLKSNWEPKPQSEEEVAEGLRSAMRQAKKDGVFDEKSHFDIIEEWGGKNKRPSLYEILMDWWTNDDWTDQTDESIIDNLVDIIDDQFIPHHHNTNDYQWNKCLKLMRDKLR